MLNSRRSGRQTQGQSRFGRVLLRTRPTPFLFWQSCGSVEIRKRCCEDSFLVDLSCTLGRRGECRRQASWLCGEEVSMKSRRCEDGAVGFETNMNINVVECDQNH